MPGILKVGRTSQDPKKRAEELSGSTGVPTPFSVAYAIEVADATKFESHLHELMDQYRINQNREFFSISLNLAIEIIEREARSMYGIDCLPKPKYAALIDKVDPVSQTVSNDHDAIRAFQDDSEEEVLRIWNLLAHAPRLDPWTMGPEAVPKVSGVYAWYDQTTPIYIGRSIAGAGLYRRIVQQHLNPLYLEPRESVFTAADHFQLSHAIRDRKNRVVIDKSAFRKKIAPA